MKRGCKTPSIYFVICNDAMMPGEFNYFIHIAEINGIVKIIIVEND